MEDIRRVENAHTLPLEEAGFDVYAGWDEELARSLVEHSREEEMLASVPNDAAVRFVDVETAHKWHKEREKNVYALGEHASAGVIWYSKQPRPELGSDYTFAIRMYEEARGRHLASAFMRAAQNDFETTTRTKSGIWLATDTTNFIARRLYKKNDYEEVGESDGRIIMVRRPGSSSE